VRHLLTVVINHSQMHDPSECTVRDGESLFAVAQPFEAGLRVSAASDSGVSGFCWLAAEQLGAVFFGWPLARAVYQDLKCSATGRCRLII